MPNEFYSKKQKNILRNGTDHRHVFSSGAVRSGKTYINNHLQIKQLPNLPQGNKAIIGKTETTVMRNVLSVMRQQFGRENVSSVHGRERKVTIFGHDYYVIGAYDRISTEKLEGIGLAQARGDEVATWPESFFKMLQSRLDKQGARFIGDCNPHGPYHWLKTEFLDREDELDLYHETFTIDDNPFLADEFVEQIKKEYSGVWYDRMIKGKWTKAEGLIYDMFDDSKHIVNSIPEIKERYVGIDYGTSNPTAFLEIGIGQDDNLYLIDEYYHEGKSAKVSKTDEEYANEFIDWLGKKKPKWIYIDPSAKSFRLALWRRRNEHPIIRRLETANNDLLDGIRDVASIMASDSLKVHERCENTIKEFGLYSWSEKNEDTPIQEHDHLCDALRYVVNGLGGKLDRILKNKR